MAEKTRGVAESQKPTSGEGVRAEHAAVVDDHRDGQSGAAVPARAGWAQRRGGRRAAAVSDREGVGVQANVTHLPGSFSLGGGFRGWAGLLRGAPA